MVREMNKRKIGFCFTVFFILMMMLFPQQFGPIPLTDAKSTSGTSSPSVVAETPLNYGLGIKDNQLLRYDGYWFVFYFNGSGLVCSDGAILCKTSLDGETWSQPTVAVNDANVSAYFSVYQSNETVVIAYSSMPPDNPLLYSAVRTKRGTISSGNITWDIPVEVFSAGNIGQTVGNFWGDDAFGKHWLAVEYLISTYFYRINIYCTEDFLSWQLSKQWEAGDAGGGGFQVTLKFVQNSRLIALYSCMNDAEFIYMFFDGSTWSSPSRTVGSEFDPRYTLKSQCEVVVNGTLYMIYSPSDRKTSLRLAVFNGSWSFSDFLPGAHYWGGSSSALFDENSNTLYFFYVNADKNQVETAFSSNYVNWFKGVKICDIGFDSPRDTRTMRYCEVEPALLWMEGTSQPYRIKFAKVRLGIVPNNFPTIQEAINNASDGDTIFVFNGTYYENVVVNKSVSIIGESRGGTVVDGNNSTTPVMWVKTGNISISELCFRNASGGGQGILVQDSLNVAITHCLVHSTTFGINVQGCSNTTISDNALTDNYGHGLELDWSNNLYVINNFISDNSNEGIYVYDCQNCSVEGNVVSGNHWSGVLIQSGSNNLLRHNTVTGNGPVGGIWLFDGTTGNLITSNIMLNNSRGIYIGFWTDYYPGPHENLVIGNNFTGNNVGIDVEYAADNVINHNKIVGNIVQARANVGYGNTWDDGYPSGGNSWSDYNGTDLFSGPYQNETGSDMIGDTQYNIEVNNTDSYPLMNADIVVTNLTTSKTRIARGHCGIINVSFEERGDYVYSFNLTVLANSTLIYSKHIMSTEVNSTFSFTWNTTGFAYGNYTIRANAEPLLGELDTTNNDLNCSVPVHVGVLGDCTGMIQGVPDGVVNMRDIQFDILLFNVKPGDPYGRWRPLADINEDNVINMRDVQIQILNFGKYEPW
jgi:nitrous oxidase accessory protein